LLTVPEGLSDVSLEKSLAESSGVSSEMLLEVFPKIFLGVFLRVLLRGGILVRRTCCAAIRKEVIGVFKYRITMFEVAHTAFDK
jgi:hypothetical protein